MFIVNSSAARDLLLVIQSEQQIPRANTPRFGLTIHNFTSRLRTLAA